jgi:hypothetical protein
LHKDTIKLQQISFCTDCQKEKGSNFHVVECTPVQHGAEQPVLKDFGIVPASMILTGKEKGWLPLDNLPELVSIALTRLYHLWNS